MSERFAKFVMLLCSAVVLLAITTAAQVVVPGAPASPAGAQPLTADLKVTVVTHTLFGETTHTENGKYFRSADGRTRQDTSHGSIIMDPKARTMTQLNHEKKEATIIQLPPRRTPPAAAAPASAQAPAPPPPGRTNDSLGEKQIGGILARGTRTVSPGDQIHNFGTVTNEVWRADEIQLALYSKQTTSNGYTVQTFENIQIGEPDAAQFVIPQGYTVTQKAGTTGAQSIMRSPPKK